MLDQLRQIAIFAKAMEHGSFRGAAAELRLSPSVVSHHIAQLEEKLGVALIYRSTRRLTLTRDGEILLGSARDMLAAVDAGLQDISGHTSEPSGALKITMAAVLSQSHLVDRVSAFKQRYPKVEITLDFSDERRDMIRDGIDLAIRTGPSRKRGANRKSLFRSDRVLIASQAYLRHGPQLDHPKDLRKSDWIELTPARGLKTVMHHPDGTRFDIAPKPYLSANDAGAVYRLARAGAGVAVVPTFLAEQDLAQGVVQIVCPDWAIEPLETYAEWPSNAPKGGISALMVQMLAAETPEPQHSPQL